MSYKYKVEAIKDIPKNVLLDNTATIETEKKWYGANWGECVGKILENGEKESFFKTDIENKNTNMLDSLIDNELCKAVKRSMYNEVTRQLYSATYYYFLYKVLEHSSEKATITEKVLSSAINVAYRYTYEILLVVDKEFKRYIYTETHTKGTGVCSLIDEINNFEQLFEEWAENAEQGFRYTDGQIEVACYSDIGEELYIEFDSMDELLMSINSIRMIDLQTEIIS